MSRCPGHEPTRQETPAYADYADLAVRALMLRTEYRRFNPGKRGARTGTMTGQPVPMGEP